jgi:hypothetical protein
LRITDLPLPLAPSRIFIRPFGRLKLKSRSTTWSSNAKQTASKTTAGELTVPSRCVTRSLMSSGRRTIVMVGSPDRERDADGDGNGGKG